MSESTTRYGFALLCALGMLVIALGAFLEILRFRRQVTRSDALSRAQASAQASNANGRADVEARDLHAISGGGIVSPRQFRLRLVSAALWMLILGALYYAVTVQWPVRHGANAMPADIEQARHFALTLLCAFVGMFIGFGLLAWDMIQLARERQAQAARFQQGLADLARSESERVRSLQGQIDPVIDTKINPDGNDATQTSARVD